MSKNSGTYFLYPILFTRGLEPVMNSDFDHSCKSLEMVELSTAGHPLSTSDAAEVLNAPGRTRTCNLRIRSPKPENDKSLSSKDLQRGDKGAYKPAYKKIPKTTSVSAESQPQDLAELTTVWPHLPDHIKAAIKALVQTSIQGD